MISFRKAAVLCSLFVILGAVMSGAGASATIGRLGTILALPGAFAVAAAAAVAVYAMTKAALPVSTSQSIVGAIVGWNLYSGTSIDLSALLKIAGTWFFSPVLSALFAFLLFLSVARTLRRISIHILTLDSLTRTALLLAGVFGSYSLGANNIANVMGVFIPGTAGLLPPIDLGLLGELSSAQQLFFFGGAAIGVGVLTYSRRVMVTVGAGIYRLSPVTAFIVVLSSSLVLFLFASEGLEQVLKMLGLPSFPLVPVSSSQAVVGAVIGVGIAKGGRNLNYRLLGRIALGWISTPAVSALAAVIFLFIVENLFRQPVY